MLSSFASPSLPEFLRERLARFLPSVWERSTVRDAVVLGVAMTVLMAGAASVDALGAIVSFAAQHEDYELDEVLTFFILLGGASSIFASRRARELRGEIERRVSAEAKMRRLAMHDGLTGLLNRVALDGVMRRAITQARRDGRPSSVLLLDLDRFKEVNDVYGHAAGDELLCTVADRLRSCVRQTDTVARLGGDEFIVVQTGLTGPAEAATLARRIVEVLNAPCTVGGHLVACSASVGVALAPVDGGEVQEVLKQADVALYRAKAEGRATFRFFEAGMDEAVRQRRLLEADLRRAVTTGEIEVHYQPQFAGAGRHCVGFEALARWRHPVRGLVSPAEFIPIAEETGLISVLGHIVLRQACAEAAGWPENLRISVNLSPLQFRQPGLVDLVAGALRDAGLTPDRLELEVTESLLIKETEEALSALSRLRELGVRVAMDDFGTGYSALGYLRRFPFDRVKIDRSFVQGLGQSDGDASIVAAIIGLSRSLGMRTTAEGVEEEEQLRFLADQGCDEFQGFCSVDPWTAAPRGAGSRSSRPHPHRFSPHLSRGDRRGR